MQWCACRRSKVEDRLGSRVGEAAAAAALLALEFMRPRVRLEDARPYIARDSRDTLRTLLLVVGRCCYPSHSSM